MVVAVGVDVAASPRPRRGRRVWIESGRDESSIGPHHLVLASLRFWSHLLSSHASQEREDGRYKAKKAPASVSSSASEMLAHRCLLAGTIFNHCNICYI